jgi:hypothetical protein
LAELGSLSGFTYLGARRFDLGALDLVLPHHFAHVRDLLDSAVYPCREQMLLITREEIASRYGSARATCGPLGAEVHRAEIDVLTLRESLRTAQDALAREHALRDDLIAIRASPMVIDRHDAEVQARRDDVSTLDGRVQDAFAFLWDASAAFEAAQQSLLELPVDEEQRRDDVRGLLLYIDASLARFRAQH